MTATTSRSTGQLALLGGSRSVALDADDRSRVCWPQVTDAERQALLGVLDSGRFTSNNSDGEVQRLEREWAAFVGVPHCAAVSNGTAAIALAFASLDLDPGAEVLVPALTFVASAIAPVQRMLVPKFVDIDPVTYTMDPAAAEAAITPRTRAILAVHLHGLPCDMDALGALARRHNLALVEDAAQAQGATYKGRRAGAMGRINAVSLNATKNLPTCGEGGLVTTDDAELHAKVVRYRQFGEDLVGGRGRDYISHILAGNEKLSAVQAAFARCQLDRLPAAMQARERNVAALLARLGELPGIVLPTCPPDRTHSWHILRLRFDPAAMGLEGLAAGPLRAAVQRVLRAEGVPVQPYQLVPLSGQGAFRTKEGFHGYPWRLSDTDTTYRIEDHPVTLALIEDSLTLQRWHLNPDSGPVLSRIADAFEKVWQHRDVLARLAGSGTYRAPWEATAS